MGNKGFLKPGDIQFMRAGSGIIHDELPSEKMISKPIPYFITVMFFRGRRFNARISNLDKSAKEIQNV